MRFHTIYYILLAIPLFYSSSCVKNDTLISKNLIHSNIAYVNKLQTLGVKFENTLCDSAMYYFLKSYELSSRLYAEDKNHSVGESSYGIHYLKSLRFLTNYFYSTKDNEALIQYGQMAIKEFGIDTTKKYCQELAYIYINLGASCLLQGKIVEATNYTFKANEIFNKYKDELGISKCFNNIGLIKYYQNEHNEALEYFKKSLNIQLKLKNTVGIADCYSKIGSIFFYIPVYDSSDYYFSKAFHLYTQTGNNLGIATCYNGMATGYSTKANDSTVLKYFRKSLSIHEKINNRSGITELTINIGNYFSYNKMYDSAYLYYRKAVEYAKEINSVFLEKNAYLRLFEMYYSTKEYEKALKFLLRYNATSKIFLDIEKNQIIRAIETSYEVEIKLKEIQTHLLKINLKNYQIKLLIFSVIIISILLSLVLSLYIKKRKAYLYILNHSSPNLINNIFEENNADVKVNEPNCNSGLSSEEKTKILNSLDYLMREKLVYREKYITLDKLAHLLNTNRTYLSLVINEYAQLSFNNYINNYRINEAKRMLEDTSNKFPIKYICNAVGFNSMNAFYESFKKIVGVPPSFYRTNIKEISKM